jgi:hypothetical protein
VKPDYTDPCFLDIKRSALFTTIFCSGILWVILVILYFWLFPAFPSGFEKLIPPGILLFLFAVISAVVGKSGTCIAYICRIQSEQKRSSLESLRASLKKTEKHFLKEVISLTDRMRAHRKNSRHLYLLYNAYENLLTRWEAYEQNTLEWFKGEDDSEDLVQLHREISEKISAEQKDLGFIRTATSEALRQGKEKVAERIQKQQDFIKSVRELYKYSTEAHEKDLWRINRYLERYGSSAVSLG